MKKAAKVRLSTRRKIARRRRFVAIFVDVLKTGFARAGSRSVPGGQSWYSAGHRGYWSGDNQVVLDRGRPPGGPRRICCSLPLLPRSDRSGQFDASVLGGHMHFFWLEKD